MPNESLIELKKRMEHPNRVDELIDYVIEHYYREQSLYLVKLISGNYYSLQKWIEKLTDSFNRTGYFR